MRSHVYSIKLRRRIILSNIVRIWKKINAEHLLEGGGIEIQFSITKRTFHAITYRNAARYNAVKR